MLANQHRLKAWYKLINYAGIVGFFFLALASGSVANVAFFGTVIVMAGWIGSGHLKARTVLAILAGAVLVITLRGVPGEYRQIASKTALFGAF